LQIITDRTFFDFSIPFIATATVLVAVWVILGAIIVARYPNSSC